MTILRFRLSFIALAFGSFGISSSIYAETLPIVAKGERGKVVQVVVRSGTTSSLGSGFWLNEDGYVATCSHVIASNGPIQIQIQSAVDSLFDLDKNNVIAANWEVFRADVISNDLPHDVAILKVSPNPFKSQKHGDISIGGVTLGAHYEKADLESKLPVPGEQILIGGYPLGLPYLVFQEGTVASIALLNDVPKILLSAVANHGNSGGPVFNDRGDVVGLLEGEIPGANQERTGIEYVVPAFFVEKLMQGISQPH
jgi:serine protease Do